MDGKIDLPQYVIEKISREFVSELFSELYHIDLRLRPALLETLTTPLYFKLAQSGVFDFHTASNPGDIYSAMVRRLELRWGDASHSPIDLEKLFGRLAFDMLTAGLEHFGIDEIERILRSEAKTSFSAGDLMNFLVGENFMYAFPGRRAGFFHQSVTEFFASVELAARYLKDTSVLVQCLSFRRWDHAVFLTLNRLQPDFSRQFFSELLRIDLEAAMRAIHHVREDRSAFVDTILRKITPSMYDQLGFEARHSMDFGVSHMPVEPMHVPALQRLSEIKKSRLGGYAAAMVAKLDSTQRLEILGRMADDTYGYNYIARLASGLQDGFSTADLRHLIELISKREIEDTDILSAASEVCSNLDPSEILEVVDEAKELPRVTNLFLIDILRYIEGQESFDRLLQFAKMGFGEAFSAMSLSFSSAHVPMATDEAADILLEAVGRGDENGRWALSTLVRLRRSGAEWRKLLLSKDHKLSQVARLTFSLQSAVDEGELGQAMKSLVAATDTLSDRQLEAVLSDFREWHSVPRDLLNAFILKRRRPIIEGMHPLPIHQFELADLEQTGEWWLAWVIEELNSLNKDLVIFCLNISGMLRTHREFRRAVVSYIVENRDRARELLLTTIVPGLGLSTDDFAPSVTEYLLGGEKILTTRFGDSLLGTLATEGFAEGPLLAAWKTSTPGSPRWRELRNALEMAGRRHNRRYVT